MDTEIKSKRGGWGSNFGFLMASIGSAVGLGNIWGFPYKMGKSGGAVFLLFYLVLVVLVGVTVMLGELALGRRSGKSAVSTYRGLSKKYTWLGYAGIVCGFCIMCFYFVLGGIVLRYAVGYFLAIFGGSEFAWSGQGTGFFGYFLTDTNSMILFFVLYILLNILVVSGGVQGGIEKFCNVGMPALFCLLVFIILYIACQPGAAEGYKFMFSPDFSVFSNPEIGFGRVLKNAAGQMFFSLSLAMGAMITYGSYLNQKEDLVKNSAIIVFADTLVATMAGIAVIPAAVANGIASGTPLDQIKLGGPNLLFVTLQDVFRAMGTVGALFGVIFYLLVLIAAISSAIALIEVDITYFLDRAEQKGRKGNRPKVAFLVCLAIFAVSVLVGIDGLGTTGVFPWPATAGWNDSMLDFVDMLSEGLAMPIGSLMMSIMVGWEIRPQTVLDELHIGYTGRIDTFYRICIKYITPIGMLLVLAGQVNEFFSLNWF